MDFQIITEQNIGKLTFVKNTDIRTDIYMSLNVKQGTWFQNPDFGSQLYKVKKVTGPNLILAKQYIQSALQWLINIGYATAIAVEAQAGTLGHIIINLTVTQANGMVLFYQLFNDVKTGKIQWSPVGGPSSNFIQP